MARENAVDQDTEHLRLLSIFHYVVAGLGALFACFPVIHLVMGLVMVFSPSSFEPHRPHEAETLRVVGIVFIAVATLIILAGWTLAACVLAAGRCLARRRRYTFCVVIAAIQCLMVPFGTVLGVFTIIVLMRPSVKPLFDQSAGAAAANRGQSSPFRSP